MHEIPGEEPLLVAAGVTRRAAADAPPPPAALAYFILNILHEFKKLHDREHNDEAPGSLSARGPLAAAEALFSVWVALALRGTLAHLHAKGGGVRLLMFRVFAAVLALLGMSCAGYLAFEAHVHATHPPYGRWQLEWVRPLRRPRPPACSSCRLLLSLLLVAPLRVAQLLSPRLRGADALDILDARARRARRGAVHAVGAGGARVVLHGPPGAAAGRGSRGCAGQRPPPAGQGEPRVAAAAGQAHSVTAALRAGSCALSSACVAVTHVCIQGCVCVWGCFVLGRCGTGGAAQA